MNGEEWIVEINSEDELIGQVDRLVAHNENGLRQHREVMLLLYTDKDRTIFLLQHRSMKKKQLPGYWTLSVTGHVDMADISEDDKEGYLTAAKRETREEIGVVTKKLELVGKVKQKITQNWAVMGVVIGEFEGEIKLDPEEVSEVGVFTKDTIFEVSDKLTPGAKACLEYLGILKQEESL